MTQNVIDAACFAAFLAAAVAANLIIEAKGPDYAPIVGAGLIGFGLVARDRLHRRWETSRLGLALGMGVLIVAGAALTYAVNADAADVAKWSALAFGAGIVADTLAFSALARADWHTRIDLSNAAGAVVDSVVFLGGLFGFGNEIGLVIAAQIFAKIAGGLLWKHALRPVLEPRAA